VERVFFIFQAVMPGSDIRIGRCVARIRLSALWLDFKFLFVFGSQTGYRKCTRVVWEAFRGAGSFMFRRSFMFWRSFMFKGETGEWMW